MNRCRSCDAPIFFAQSATTGALIPFDAEPVPGGSHIIDALGFARAASESYEAQPTYVSHFATCPNAAKHRRATRRRQLPIPE